MNVMFNELSITKVTTTKEQGNKILEVFLDFCITLHKLSLDKESNILIFGDDSFSKLVSNNLNTELYEWGKSLPNNKREHFRRFQKMLTEYQKPLSLPEIKYKEDEKEIEYAHGLGYAFENNLMAISLPIKEEWKRKEITLIRYDVKEDLQDEEKEVVLQRNANSKEDLIYFEIWKEYIIKNLKFINEDAKIEKDGQNLNEKKTQINLFPNLSASDELVNNVIVKNLGLITDWSDFNTKIRKIGILQRIPIIENIATSIAEINGWKYLRKLKKCNAGRVVFISSSKKEMYIALDTETITWEVHNSKGEHEAEFNFDGSFNKHSTHVLNLDCK